MSEEPLAFPQPVYFLMVFKLHNYVVGQHHMILGPEGHKRSPRNFHTDLVVQFGVHYRQIGFLMPPYTLVLLVLYPLPLNKNLK